MKKILGAIAVAATLATPLAAQVDVTGKWQITSETPRGEMTQTIMLQQDGNSLTGTMERGGGMAARGGAGGRGGGRGGGGMGGPLEIQSGAVDGNTVTFLIIRGRGDRTFEMEYHGTLDGDTITGTMSTMRGDIPFTMVRVET